MPHKLRKTRKYRGSRTCGWGQVGQHRKHGMRGGYGKAGGHKDKWTYIVKYAPDYFKRKGFLSHTGIGDVPVINIGQLDEIVDKLVTGNALEMENGKFAINLSELGIVKLLGEGVLSKPLIVKVEKHSQLAEKKIQDAGGQLLRLAD